VAWAGCFWGWCDSISLRVRMAFEGAYWARRNLKRVLLHFELVEQTTWYEFRALVLYFFASSPSTHRGHGLASAPALNISSTGGEWSGVAR